MATTEMTGANGFGECEAASLRPGHLSIVAADEGATSHRLRLRGEIDLASAPALYEQITPLIYNGNEVVIDLSGVTFMDSSGLNLILRLREHCRESGCRLLLVSPGRSVLRLLEITGMIVPMQEQGLLAE